MWAPLLTPLHTSAHAGNCRGSWVLQVGRTLSPLPSFCSLHKIFLEPWKRDHRKETSEPDQALAVQALCPKCVVSSAVRTHPQLLGVTKGHMDNLYYFGSRLGNPDQPFKKRLLVSGTGVFLVYGSWGDNCEHSKMQNRVMGRGFQLGSRKTANTEE